MLRADNLSFNLEISWKMIHKVSVVTKKLHLAQNFGSFGSTCTDHHTLIDKSGRIGFLYYETYLCSLHAFILYTGYQFVGLFRLA